MILTKYEHACFVVEKAGKKVIIDPGGFTTDLDNLNDIVAIILTHEHFDHLDIPNITRIIDENPEAKILGHSSLKDQLSDLPFQPVSVGENVTIEPFHLTFFGGEHAEIHPSIPHIANLGVMVNNSIYYPGDSFTLPNQPVDVLALPVSAPWLKLSESFDFMTSVRPKIVFPTHDALLSAAGNGLVDRMVGLFASKINARYQRLVEPIEINSDGMDTN